MLKKFQARYLLNAIMAVAFTLGYSQQMMGQFSEHHHENCEHAQTSHEGHDHDDHDGDDSPIQDSHQDCTCLICALSFANPVTAPVAFRAPTFSLSEIPARLATEAAPQFALSIDRPPRA